MKYRVGMNVQGELVWCFMGLRNERRGAEGAERLREDDAFDAVFEEGDVKVDEKG